jgi:aldehyde:ferredoxin oxidoreductase
VEQPNHFYRALAQGVERAASLYGGRDFALAFGGNEMPGYHTGPAAHLGVLIGARHSHLDNAGYSLDQKVLAKNLVSPRELAETLLMPRSTGGRSSPAWWSASSPGRSIKKTWWPKP